MRTSLPTGPPCVSRASRCQGGGLGREPAEGRWVRVPMSFVEGKAGRGVDDAEELERELQQLEDDLKLLERLSNVGVDDTAVQDTVESAMLAVRPPAPS